MTDALNALCPLDGRYQKTGARLSLYFSEKGLILHRLIVMVEWVRMLVDHEKVPTPVLTDVQYRRLRYPSLLENLDEGAVIIKAIETTGTTRWRRTNHDVKACEYHLRDIFEEYDLRVLTEWIHFGRTSADVNTMALALMLFNALRVLESDIERIKTSLRRLAMRHADLAMLARTHGQPATPTTLGKEFSVFEKRIGKLLARLKSTMISVKWNGASGNHNAEFAAFPDIDWVEVARKFCSRVDLDHRLVLNTHTTQIEPHDNQAEIFDTIAQINTVLLDLVQDSWRYISDDWLVQRAVEGEVGSSAMPHKVNPINFENAEGNLGVANALLRHFSEKLPISRLQRDLSDSTVERNFGMALGYCLLSYEAIQTGLGKIAPNEEKIQAVLADHPEVLTEAYQTILRSVNYPNAYDALKSLARGKKLTLEDLREWVRGLDDTLVPAEAKDRMLALTPRKYLGLASELASGIII